jgi:tetratricopeptide (TPR) repeat protein
VNADSGHRSTPTASELFEAGLAAFDTGATERAAAVWAEVVETYWESSEPDVRAVVARALFAKADTLREAGRLEDALVDFERLDARFGDANEPDAVALRAANGLFAKALALETLGRSDEEAATYELLVQRYADRSDPELRTRVARAFLNKALTHKTLKRDDEVVSTYQRLDAQFGSADETLRVVNIVSRGLLNQALALGRLGRHEEEIQLYREVVDRYGASSDPEVRGRAIRALFNTALTLRQLKRDEDVVAVYERLDAQFGAVDGPIASVRLLNKGLLNRALAMDRLGRHQEEIELYDELAARYRDSIDPEIRGHVANALRNKALTLRDLNCLDDATATYDDLDTRYGDPEEPGEVSRHVAAALRGKGLMLDRVDRYEDGLRVYDLVISRYRHTADQATVSQVAWAFQDKATTLWILNRRDDALKVLDELIALFGDSSESFFLQKMAQGLERKARMLSELGRVEEAMTAFDDAIGTLATLSLDDRTPLLIDALFYKAEALMRTDQSAEALVLLTSVTDTFSAWPAQTGTIAAQATATFARAVLHKISIFVGIGQAAEIAAFVEPLMASLGDIPEPEEFYERQTLSESDLAALLAENHGGNCWFEFATAEDDYQTRRQMAERATDLYRRTMPWILDAFECDEADDESEDDDDEELSPLLAAMALRTIADGYALLSISATDRAKLPLPTLGLFEYFCQRFGIDDWARENGHPMVPSAPTESVEQLLSEERTKALEQLHDDDTDLDQRFVDGFSVAAWSYHVLSLLPTMQNGGAVMRDQRIKRFSVDQIGQGRRWATWANSSADDAAPAAVAMVLMGQALYSTSNTSQSLGSGPRLSRAGLRDLLDDTDALEWLQQREASLPPWLRPKTES